MHQADGAAFAPCRDRLGFTLIELLVVIAIIGILAVLLFPVLGKAREASEASLCVSNMRQVAQGLLLYAADHDGWGPAGNNKDNHEEQGGDPGVTSLNSTYFSLVWPYIYPQVPLSTSTPDRVTFNSKKKNVFLCPTRYARYPTAEKAPAEMFVGGKGSSYAVWDNYSYPINGLAAKAPLYSSDGNRVAKKVKVIGMTAPSKTVAIVEGYTWYVMVSYYYQKYGVLPHNKKANFAFYDGHVETLGLSQIPTEQEALQSVFWSGDNVQ